MDETTERAVRERAYWIWVQQGRPDGQHELHWQMALQDLGIEKVPENKAPENEERRTGCAKPNGEASTTAEADRVAS